MGCIPSSLSEAVVDDNEEGKQSPAPPSMSTTTTKLSPRRECEGYPPPMIPRTVNTDLVEEVEFFIEGSQKGVALACSLVKYIGPRSTTTNATSTTPLETTTKKNNYVTVQGFNNTSIPGTRFDIDPALPLIIICHGFLSWRNQMLIGHLGINLSYQMKCHTLRFDFTGDGHSEGEWRQGNYSNQVQDLQCIVNFIQTQMKIHHVSCIIGHSKGCVAILRYAWEQESQQREQHQRDTKETAEESKQNNSNQLEDSSNKTNYDVDNMTRQHRYHVPHFVAMSGRFYPQEKSEMLNALSIEERQSLEQVGQYTRYILGTKRKFVVTVKDFDERASLDSNFVSKIQQSTILIIHGDQDTTVPVSNASLFAEQIPNNKLMIIQGANHSFNGTKYIQVLVQGISDFCEN